MNRGEAKAICEQHARYAAVSIRRAIGNEINPSKTRQSIQQVADYLHRACVSFSRAGASDEALDYFDPLIDALGLLKSAICAKPLDRTLCCSALYILNRIAKRVECN